MSETNPRFEILNSDIGWNTFTVRLLYKYEDVEIKIEEPINMDLPFFDWRMKRKKKSMLRKLEIIKRQLNIDNV